MMRLRCLAVCAFALSCPQLRADQVLYSMSLDGMGGSALVSISPTTGDTATLATFPSLAFNGGLTYDPATGLFYAIANDFNSYSSFYQITSDGVATSLAGLGYGYYGGLALDTATATFYAISGDAYGVQRAPSSWTLGGAITDWGLLGDGSMSFNGGLTVTGSGLEAIANDAYWASYLYSLGLNASPTPSSATAVRSDLGSGFASLGLAAGGLASDGSLYYALASDQFGAQALASFTATPGGSVMTFTQLGGPYSGLVLADTAPGAAVPEPATLALVGLGLLILGRFRRP